MKKFFAVLMALVLVLSMGTVALAAGETGTITITNAVKDETYTVYKMLNFAPTADASDDKGIYTIADGWEAFFTTGAGKDYFEIADNGSVTKTDDPDAELAAAAVAYGKTATGGFSESKDAEGTSVEFSGLGLGYYAVDTSVGAICSLTNTNSEETLIEKNSTPTLVKKIVEGDKLVDANNVAIGDDVDYQITVTVGEGLTDYVVRDTMSDGLTYNGDAKVYVDDTEVTTGFTVAPTADGFTVTFDNDYIATLEKNEEIVIKFSAKLNNSATVGSTGNPNTAVLDYKNESEVETTPEDTVITYTTKLVIDKIDGDTQQPLEGAGFTLYKDSVADENKIGDELTTGSTFTWTGLEAGEYILVETTVPAGYNGVKNIEFEIAVKEPEEVKTGDETAEWSTTSTKISAEDASTFYGKIENNTGSLLPETGGIGTTIFYVVGLALMLGAAILLITKKRMTAKAE